MAILFITKFHYYLDTICSFKGNPSPPRGYVAHPGFPGPVTQFKTCVWAIKLKNGNPSISYKLLGLKKDPGFCYDSMVRQNFGNNQQPHCGCSSLPKNDRATSDTGFVQFVSRRISGAGQPGFLLYYNHVGRFVEPALLKANEYFYIIKPQMATKLEDCLVY